MERTLIILKPDAVQRGLAGKIITRFEEKGLQIVGMKMLTISQELAAKHYAPHKGKPFYDGLVRFMTSSPVIVLALQGRAGAGGVIETARKMMGATFGFKAEPGTIRGDFGVSSSFNLIHGSDSPESAAAEIALWFKPEELQGYEMANSKWTYDWSKGNPE
jgi:nucleoside-diphosphate kinase